ncbi:prolyl oligopeptidase family serine peptidase [Chromatiaceae bacterium AAb-1]|nr:prolyl oligopeptidase family serine peptidase [Chromatiaceae bacterium AAb-1]
MLRILLCMFCFIAVPAAAFSYQLPDEKLAQLVDASATASWQLSAGENWLLQLETAENPLLAELQQETAELAGLRINIARLSAGLGRGYQQVTVQQLAGDKRYVLTAGQQQRFYRPVISPDEQWLSVVVAEKQGLFIELVSLKNGKRKRLSARLNAVFGIQYQWLNDSSGLLAVMAPAGKTSVSAQTAVQPKIQESTTEKVPQRTLQLLLQSAADAAHFEQLIAARLVRVSTGMKMTVLTEQPLYDFSLSPDNRFVLTQRIVRPYSYSVRASNFPRTTDVYTLGGQHLTTVEELALHESREVRNGRRIIAWRPDQAASLYWVQKSQHQQYKDEIWQWPAPFAAGPEKLYDTEWRFRQVLWSDNQLAVLYEADSKTEQERAWLFPSGLTAEKQLWYQRHVKDLRAFPGEIVTRLNRYLRQVIRQQQPDTLYISGQHDDTLQAELLSWNFVSGQRQLLWQSGADADERVIRLLNDDSLLFSRQTPVQPPQLLQLKQGKEYQLVTRAHPAPAYQGVSQQFVEYQRADGVKLSGWLYLPAGYDVSLGPLPTLMWAYPREYASAELAEQRTVNANRFVSFRTSSAQPYAALGYAVFDQVSMPVISQHERAPNDDFLPQLIANAEAAVTMLTELGVSEKGNIAVGGHSYGAFMVANLLAHTDLFSAGIARSGAYNRTLTPFGFQSEKRHLWENPQLYSDMSPFLHADKITAPLLLIHGEADPNSGTYPMQSVRMFEALKGLGKVSRLVLLPYEGHHYQARESVLHLLWEQQQWLLRYLKPTSAMAELHNKIPEK